MKKFFYGLLITLVIVSVVSYFGAKWINEHWDEHFTLNTIFFGNNDAPDDSVQVDPDTQFTFTVNYYANKDNSGVEMYELKVSYYTDID